MRASHCLLMLALATSACSDAAPAGEGDKTDGTPRETNTGDARLIYTDGGGGQAAPTGGESSSGGHTGGTTGGAAATGNGGTAQTSDAEPGEPKPDAGEGGAPVPVADAGQAQTPDAARPQGPSRLEPPPIPAYSGGACPVFAGGPTNEAAWVGNFPSSGDTRGFRMIVPPNYDGSEPWPVMFAWHWLNAESSSFVNQGELESAAEEMRFLVVVPEHLQNPNGDKTYILSWPFAELWGADKELVFFQDLLACVDANFNIDPRQIHGIGVSAGALWLNHLANTPLADHLASIVSLSGGLGTDPFGVWNMMFTPQEHKYPAIVLWGGPTDNLVIVDFQAASIRLKDSLIRNGQFVVSCTHDSGHAVPPIDSPADGGTRFRFLWQFMADHPYGTPPGESPWQDSGLPADAPAWCEIATP